MSSIENAVRQNIHCNVTELVTTLAAGGRRSSMTTSAVDHLMRHAATLADPVEDKEVYEFWAVSEWLAERLIEHGEKVDTDFAALNIWARTTTGQAIHMDYCIKRIFASVPG